MTVAEQFGRKLFMARRRAGLTQTQLERRSSMTQNYISGLERGRRCPSLRTVVRLAKALEMPASDLLRGIE